MRSVFDIARSHVPLPVSKDSMALRRVLRDWLDYTECQPLQKKPAFPATLCVTVRSPLNSESGAGSQSGIKAGTRSNPQLEGCASRYRTKHVPLLLWTAVLPWEVQRGLSMSTLELPRNDDDDRENDCVQRNGADKEAHLGGEGLTTTKEPRDVDDPYGVVTNPIGNALANTVNISCCSAPAASMTPGMLFVMSPESASQGLCFWSGAIRHSIDVAFVAAVEPAATNTPSFNELRRKRLQTTSVGYDVGRFFPDGELDSPTVTFAVQSHSYLDPFPSCGFGGSSLRGNSSNHGNDDVESSRRHTAAPEGVGCGNGSVRYVLETKRYLLRDSVASALRECRCDHGDGALSYQPRSVHDAKDTSKGVGDTEVTISLLLSDELKEDLRGKARLYTNYVVPLEAHISHHIRCLNGIPSRSPSSTPAGADNPRGEGTVVPFMGSSSDSVSGSSRTVTPSGIIKPPVPMELGTASAAYLRSPMLADELEGRPKHLAPSFLGKHDAPTLQRAQKQHNQLISASSLARISNASPNVPQLPSIDYELFDLCLRLGLCHSDVVYYFHGRIMREWKRELQRLRTRNACGGTEAVKGHEMRIRDEDILRMLRLINDPSIQTPFELASCVEAVARMRQIDWKAGLPPT